MRAVHRARDDHGSGEHDRPQRLGDGGGREDPAAELARARECRHRLAGVQTEGLEAGTGGVQPVAAEGAEELLRTVDRQIAAEDRPGSVQTDVPHVSSHGLYSYLFLTIVTIGYTVENVVADALEGNDNGPQGACDAMTHVFALLGKRWSGLIIATLLDGAAQVLEIARLVPGVSERMLSERLSELGAAGLVDLGGGETDRR